MASVISIEPGPMHGAIVRISPFEGFALFRVPEAINIATPPYDPPGTCCLKVENIPPERKDFPDNTIIKRGPETVLNSTMRDEQSEWKEIAQNHLQLTIKKPGVFLYQADILASNSAVCVTVTLTNDSLWDWRDAYVYFCCCFNDCPAFCDPTAERTTVFTGTGPEFVKDLPRRVWANFRPSAQYFEDYGRPMPKTKDGFAFDECGISPEPVTAGLVLRQAENSDTFIAVASRRFHNIFMDLQANNCIHVNPSAGDLLAGDTATLHGSLYILKGSRDEVAAEAAKLAKIPLASLPEIKT